MNPRKTNLVMKKNVAMINRIISEWMFPIPMKCSRAVLWWLVFSIISISVQGELFPSGISNHVLGFIFGMVLLCFLTPVFAVSYLFGNCDWSIVIMAYTLQASVLLILSKTSRRWLQIIAITIVLAQSIVGIYGVIHSI
jgi:hypothetical protein